MKSAFTSSQQKAIHEQQDYMVNITSSRVRFFSYGVKASRYKDQIIKVPTSLRPHHVYKIKIKKDGFVAPCSIVWLDKNNSSKYEQVFQLGWSGFRIDKKF